MNSIEDVPDTVSTIILKYLLTDSSFTFENDTSDIKQWNGYAITISRDSL